MASKFLLIICMAKEFPMKDVGIYALVVSGISYLGYLLGFDFYTYSSREVIAGSKSEKSKKIKNQFLFYFILYFVSIIIALFVFYSGGGGGSHILLFCAILILEHFSQEIMRLLVVFGMPIMANIQFFIRGGLWVYLYIPYLLLAEHVTLNELWYFWLFGDFLSLGFILPLFRRLSLKEIIFDNIDWKWIFGGLKVCLPLLVATLALRGMFTVDRYLLNYLADKTVVGTYSYFASFSSALMAFVDAGVVVIFYPKLVHYYKSNEHKLFEHYKKKFYKSIIVTGIGVGICLAIGVPLISYFLNKQDIASHYGIFYILLLGSFVYCLSLVPHFELYARGMDKEIIFSTIISFAIGLLSMFVFGIYFSSYGVAIGQLISITSLFYIKYKVTKR